LAPILKNEKNLNKFPQCVADDIKRQVHELSTSVYQIRGHIKGKTLLPFPQQGSARIEAEEARVKASKGEDCDMTLKNNIEGIIIKWAYQIEEVLSKDSAEELNLPDNYPGPMTEIRFWEAKCTNLESLFEQMKDDTTKKMASILDVTDSAYYPCFRSMFRNVVAALNEAQDITLFLRPLGKHFQVYCNSTIKMHIFMQQQ
jgi:dynein heavy chain